MTTPETVNRERVAHGLSLLGQGLGPYVDRQMRNRRGPEWLAALEKADAYRTSHPVAHTLGDPELLLRLVVEEPFFHEIIPAPGVKVAQVLRSVVHRAGHEGVFSDGEAGQALRTMAQLLRLIGARKLAVETQRLVTPEPPPPPREARTTVPRPRLPKLPKLPRLPKLPGGKARSGGGGAQIRLTTFLVAGLAVLAAFQVLGSRDSPDDPYEGAWASREVGAELVRENAVTLPDRHHLVLLEATPKEKPFRGDVYYQAGSLHASDRRLAVLPKDGPAGYARCRDAREHVSRADGDVLTKGARLCVVTDTGAVALLTVTERRTEPDRSLTFALRVWKGPRPD
ncbi:hypothetical protein LO762_06260 [Actinocorallia sp. API 0066]|uniref:Swt1 family HEPN domain-containing protein n=1 Tax=Actinocorallia sp. API 0066 TaxID=2896846 RepID=UPI001E58430F|nr:Swt1 family HEPN domain-containing protein [Actinocorallia sp. API 0066]MCD0448798.1 hypothetical protein [Actinocorallia sp. API 0066]